VIVSRLPCKPPREPAPPLHLCPDIHIGQRVHWHHRKERNSPIALRVYTDPLSPFSGNERPCHAQHNINLLSERIPFCRFNCIVDTLRPPVPDVRDGEERGGRVWAGRTQGPSPLFTEPAWGGIQDIQHVHKVVPQTQHAGDSSGSGAQSYAMEALYPLFRLQLKYLLLLVAISGSFA